MNVRESMQTKRCSNCKKTLPVDEFHRIGPAKAKIGNWCEPCYQMIKTRRALAKAPSLPPGNA